VEDEISIAIEETKLVSQIHSLADVVSTEYEDEVVKLKYRTTKQNSNRINKLILNNRKSEKHLKKDMSVG